VLSAEISCLVNSLNLWLKCTGVTGCKILANTK
jgi:hypothetical protein